MVPYRTELLFCHSSFLVLAGGTVLLRPVLDVGGEY
jgi:hypothetical protein